MAQKSEKRIKMKRKAREEARTNLTVLVDMDGVLANFDARAYELMKQRHAHIKLPPWVARRFPLSAGVAREQRPPLVALFSEEGFFREMQPIEGAVAALREMVAAGLDVRICTAPLATSPRCAMEKIEWVIHHLGPEWVDRIVLTRDKTLIRGDWLIDDAPKAKGSAMQPEWRQIYFDQPYNRPEAGSDPSLPRLLRWRDWRAVLMGGAPTASGPDGCLRPSGASLSTPPLPALLRR